MSKSIINDLGNEFKGLDPVELLRKNRMTNQRNQAESSDGTVQVTTPEIVINDKSDDSPIESTKTTDGAKGERRGRKHVKRTAYVSKGISNEEWNNILTFTEDIPTIEYGNKSQRISDDNHFALDEMAKRIGVPAVHLLNHIITLFRERYRDDFNKKYPSRSI